MHEFRLLLAAKKILAQDGKMRSVGFLVVFYCEEGKEEALNEEAAEIQPVVMQAGTFEED